MPFNHGEPLTTLEIGVSRNYTIAALISLYESGDLVMYENNRGNAHLNAKLISSIANNFIKYAVNVLPVTICKIGNRQVAKMADSHHGLSAWILGRDTGMISKEELASAWVPVMRVPEEMFLPTYAAKHNAFRHSTRQTVCNPDYYYGFTIYKLIIPRVVALGIPEAHVCNIINSTRAPLLARIICALDEDYFGSDETWQYPCIYMGGALARNRYNEPASMASKFISASMMDLIARGLAYYCVFHSFLNQLAQARHEKMGAIANSQTFFGLLMVDFMHSHKRLPEDPNILAGEVCLRSKELMVNMRHLSHGGEAYISDNVEEIYHKLEFPDLSWVSSTYVPEPADIEVIITRKVKAIAGAAKRLAKKKKSK